MHGTIRKPATLPNGKRCRVMSDDLVDAAGRFVLSRIMTQAHDCRHNAAINGFPITFATALREAWSRAHDVRGMRRDLAELAARAARGDRATPANTAAYSDDPRISAEYARSLIA